MEIKLIISCFVIGMLCLYACLQTPLAEMQTPLIKSDVSSGNSGLQTRLKVKGDSNTVTVIQYFIREHDTLRIDSIIKRY